jgi:hypothetical protein
MEIDPVDAFFGDGLTSLLEEERAFVSRGFAPGEGNMENEQNKGGVKESYPFHHGESFDESIEGRCAIPGWETEKKQSRARRRARKGSVSAWRFLPS